MKRFDEFCNIFKDNVLKTNKKIIICGYDYHGAYCNWLIKKITGKNADVIIDNNLCVYGLKIYRELSLDDLDEKEYVGIVTDSQYLDMLSSRGFDVIYLENIFNTKEFGFYQWLESKYKVDLFKTINKDDLNYDFSKYSTNSGPSRQLGLYDVISQFKKMENISNLKVLDIGCGKGAAIEIFNQFDFKKVDGIEYSKKISNIAKQNMYKLNESTDIYNCSACDFDDYNYYDIFYMYDPFKNPVFKDVVYKLENQVKHRAYIIYANPYLSKEIEKNKVYKLTKKIDTDFFHRNVKIYRRD